MSARETAAIGPVSPARGEVMLGQALVHPVPDEAPLQATVLAEKLHA